MSLIASLDGVQVLTLDMYDPCPHTARWTAQPSATYRLHNAARLSCTPDYGGTVADSPVFHCIFLDLRHFHSQTARQVILHRPAGLILPMFVELFHLDILPSRSPTDSRTCNPSWLASRLRGSLRTAVMDSVYDGSWSPMSFDSTPVCTSSRCLLHTVPAPKRGIIFPP